MLMVQCPTDSHLVSPLPPTSCSLPPAWALNQNPLSPILHSVSSFSRAAQKARASSRPSEMERASSSAESSLYLLQDRLPQISGTAHNISSHCLLDFPGTGCSGLAVTAPNDPSVFPSLISWRHCPRNFKHFRFTGARLVLAQATVSKMHDWVFLSGFELHRKSSEVTVSG